MYRSNKQDYMQDLRLPSQDVIIYNNKNIYQAHFVYEEENMKSII